MRLRSLLPLLLLANAPVVAQDAYVNLWGGGLAGGISLPSFGEFRTSFDRVNAGFATGKFEDLSMTRGWQVGLSVMLNEHLGVSLSYMTHRSSTTVSFTDGSSRTMQHDLYTPLTGGIHIIAGPVVIHPRFGYCTAQMRSWTEYPDGTVSYGNERLLNGMFRTYGLFAGSDLGLRIKFSEAFGMVIGGGWYAVSGSDYDEPNTARIMDTEPVYPISIPTQWDRWLELRDANDLTSYDVNDVVKLKGSWYHLYVNLSIDLK